jgi:hypothetical protein
VREPALAEDLGDLDVGVGFGVHAAEQLEDEPLVVHDRRVRLVDDERPGDGGRLVGRHLLEHGEGQLGVDEGVVPQPAVDLADRHALLAQQEVVVAAGGPATEHHLVGGHPAVGVADVEQVPRQRRLAVAQVEGGDGHRGGGLVACVPPLPRQELPQQRSQLLGQIVEAWHVTCLALIRHLRFARDRGHKHPAPLNRGYPEGWSPIRHSPRTLVSAR